MILFAVILFVLSGGTTHAATYYTATTGSNSNDGLSESTPFLTVAKCTDTMVAGDTCYVRGGTYNEGVVRFRVTGTSSSPIKLLAYPNELPVIHFIDPASPNYHRMLVQHASGYNVAIGWITISGFEIENGYHGINVYNMHDSIIEHNHIHDNLNQGILGNGTRMLVTRNKIESNGGFAECITTPSTCNKDHGIYVNGTAWTITNNVIYGNLANGIVINGTSGYNPVSHAGVEFAQSHNWIISDNTFAYNDNRPGIVVWGSQCDNARIENNIFYENSVTLSTGSPQGVEFVSATNSTGVKIRNNHFYASGSGGQLSLGSGQPADIVITGNVVNVSAPAFVNGGSNSLPASPDFRLTASAPVNIARVNEFSNNTTLVVGAYKTVGTPTAVITANKIIVNLLMSTATPIQNLSTTGVSVACTGSACPGSPTVSAVAREVNTDSQVGVTIAGITGDACEAANQTWTVSYTTASGTWTANDNIGTYPGSHQKIFSFTNLAVTNQCTGSGPPAPSGYHLYYKFDEGTGTSANDESANNLDGTLTNGPTWGAGNTGYGVVMTGNDSKYVAVPYGSGVNPSTQSLTVAFGVNVEAGMEALTRGYFGAPIGSGRFYISTAGGTWRMGIQSHAATSAGSIAVTSGWHHVCLVADSGTDIATLYIDGVASTTTVSYTSFSLSGNFELGRIAGVSTGAAATYDEFLIYTSAENCATLSAEFHAVPPAITGTLAQAAIQFQGVILGTDGNPFVVGPSVQTIEVPAGGGAVILFQVHCTNVSDCDPTAYKLVYAKNGASTWQQVPDVETSDGTYMWGVTTESNVNNGTRSTRLTGSCTLTTGATQITSAQTPAIDLPQDGCTVLAYIIRIGSLQAGNYFDYKLRTEADADLTTYTQTARVRAVNPMASGIGF